MLGFGCWVFGVRCGAYVLNIERWVVGGGCGVYNWVMVLGIV